MYEFAVYLDIYSIFVVIQGVKLTKCRFKKEQIVSSIILETKICAKFFCWEALTQTVASLDHFVSKLSVTAVKYLFSGLSHYYKHSASIQSH